MKFRCRFFDEPMTVIGDTTAMSVPHEVEYTLTFASESVASVQSSGGTAMGGVRYCDCTGACGGSCIIHEIAQT